jgi:hypothetical protein
MAAAQVAQPPMPVVLTCQLIQLPFAPGVAKVTNISTATLPPGSMIKVFAVQAGSAAGASVIGAPLPPGASVSITLTGSSQIARGCVANVG